MNWMGGTFAPRFLSGLFLWKSLFSSPGGNSVTTGILSAYQYSDLIFVGGSVKMRRLVFKFYSAPELTEYCSFNGVTLLELSGWSPEFDIKVF